MKASKIKSLPDCTEQKKTHTNRTTHK